MRGCCRYTGALVLGFLALVVAETHGQASELPLLSYRVELVQEPQLQVRVRLALHGDATGVTRLMVDDQWGGVTAGGEDITTVTASTTSGVSLAVERPEPHRVVVHHEPGASLDVSYVFLANDHHMQSDPSLFRRPLLNEGLFHTVGHLAWLRPEDLQAEDPCRLRFEWHGFDEAGWAVVTSWGVGSQPREVETALQDLTGSLYIAGDFALMTHTIQGYPLTVTVAGDLWEFTPDEFADLCAEVVEVERTFFEDFERDFYWISLAPAGTPRDHGLSIGGTALLNCFSLGVTPNASLGTDQPGDGELLRILTHEMFHEWNGQLIPREEPEELVYWFSEGFTDFYARRLRYRGGWLDVDEYAASVNETLAKLMVSPERNAPNERILEDFWNDRNLRDLPYLRGDVIAMILDAAIRRTSDSTRSLDDLMRELVAEGRAGQRISVDLLLEKFAEYGDAATAETIRSIVEEGATPSVPEDLFSPCLEVRIEDVFSFDPGFHVNQSIAERKIIGIREGSSGFEAGLRDGMPLEGWSVNYGDVEQEATFSVRVDGELRRISYLPRGAVVRAPQVVPGEERADCERL